MKKILSLGAIAALAVFVFAAAPASAAGIKYYEDPVYQKLAPDDHLPMEDMMMLAEDGDVRAQYIMGDLYSKGKGGFSKNLRKARSWFETSARNGYAFSFIRLAALAKRQRNPADAYQWYTLALKHCKGEDRAWAQKARDQLVADARLTPEEMEQARKAANAWEDRAVEKNRADREEKKRKEENLVGPKKAANEETTVKTKTIEKSTFKTERYRNGDN